MTTQTQTQTPNSQPAAATAAQATPLPDEALDDASGGIIAILIGLATQPKVPLGDGSVRQVASGVVHPLP